MLIFLKLMHFLATLIGTPCSIILSFSPLTFRSLGRKCRIEIEGFVRNYCRLEWRILLFLPQFVPIDFGEETVVEDIVYTILTWNQKKGLIQCYQLCLYFIHPFILLFYLIMIHETAKVGNTELINVCT